MYNIDGLANHSARVSLRYQMNLRPGISVPGLGEARQHR
jgi:hypothetical protein